jgi:hypothetical protein
VDNSSTCHPITCLCIFLSMLWCPVQFPHKTMFGSSFLPFSHLFRREFTFYWCYMYLFTYTCVQHDFHIRWYSCCLQVTWQVPLVEQELLTILEHLCSALVLSGVHVVQSLVFCLVFCRSLFVFFLLAIILSFFLWFTASDYPFGIFKLFSSKSDHQKESAEK